MVRGGCVDLVRAALDNPAPLAHRPDETRSQSDEPAARAREMDGAFLFQESEFEGDAFDAPAFVAKYRRVNSLESLRDQLRQYCEALKVQLYTVINKDYKDFITIATKLDGVDSRVELLRKPLVDLRLDLSLLHDGLLSSKQALQDTLARKQEVTNKRRHVENALLCLEKLDVAEGIVGASSTKSGGVGGEGGNGRSRRDLLHALHKAKAVAAASAASAQTYSSSSSSSAAAAAATAPSSSSSSSSSVAGLSSSAFDSSELERAAHALAQAQAAFDSFAQTQQNQQQLPAALVTLSKTLSSRLTQLSALLLGRIKARLGDVLSEASSASASGDGGSGAVLAAASDSMKRSLAHCLRALSALRRGDVAEGAVSDFIAPIVKNTLTLGRVDGAGGRGSYSGLKEALAGLLVALGASLTAPLTLAEGVFGGGQEHVGDAGTADLLVCGVWVPVLAVLQERFPGLFSVGIASTLARCYRAVEAFTQSLVDLVDFPGLAATAASASGATSGSGQSGAAAAAELRAAVLARVQSHPAVRELHARWDLSLYGQLRVREVGARLERACEVATAQGLTANAFEAVHSAAVATATPVPAPAAQGGEGAAATAAATAAAVPKALARTLTASEVSELRVQFSLGAGAFHLPLVLAVAVEAATCLHSQVLLTPLLPELLALALRCVCRLEAHVAASVGVPTPSFPRGAASLPAAGGSAGAGAGASAGAGEKEVLVGASSSTPSKAGAAGPNTPGQQQQSSGSNASPDELVLLAADLFALARWLRSALQPRVASLLPDAASGAAAAAAHKTVDACLGGECARLDATRAAVWARLSALLSADCRRSLQAVKAVAGKYRMTNKPPPETASPYVESVLAPLK